MKNINLKIEMRQLKRLLYIYICGREGSNKMITIHRQGRQNGSVGGMTPIQLTTQVSSYNKQTNIILAITSNK